MPEIILVIMLIICLITDLNKRKMYNVVLFPALFFALGYHLAVGGWFELGQSLLGFLAGLCILFIPFTLGGMGAGDVKLLAVIGAIKGPLFIFYTALGMALAGGIISLIILIYKRQLINLFGRLLSGIKLLFATGGKVVAFDLNREKIMFPYGLAIVAGTASAFWWMG